MQTRQSSNQYTCMCLALFHLLNFCKKESLWKLNIIEIKAYTASFIKKNFILSIKLIKCLLHSWYACISQVVTTAMKLNWNHFMWYKQEYPTCKTFTTLLDTIQKKNPLKYTSTMHMNIHVYQYQTQLIHWYCTLYQAIQLYKNTLCTRVRVCNVIHSTITALTLWFTSTSTHIPVCTTAKKSFLWHRVCPQIFSSQTSIQLE